MKRTKSAVKSLLSLVLAICMIATYLPVTALAENDECNHETFEDGVCVNCSYSCEHNYSTVVSTYDAENHAIWCQTCGMRVSLEAHEDQNEDHVCDICSQDMNVQLSCSVFDENLSYEAETEMTIDGYAEVRIYNVYGINSETWKIESITTDSDLLSIEHNVENDSWKVLFNQSGIANVKVDMRSLNNQMHEFDYSLYITYPEFWVEIASDQDTIQSNGSNRIYADVYKKTVNRNGSEYTTQVYSDCTFKWRLANNIDGVNYYLTGWNGDTLNITTRNVSPDATIQVLLDVVYFDKVVATGGYSLDIENADDYYIHISKQESDPPLIERTVNISTYKGHDKVESLESEYAYRMILTQGGAHDVALSDSKGDQINFDDKTKIDIIDSDGNRVALPNCPMSKILTPKQIEFIKTKRYTRDGVTIDILLLKKLDSGQYECVTTNRLELYLGETGRWDSLKMDIGEDLKVQFPFDYSDDEDVELKWYLGNYCNENEGQERHYTEDKENHSITIKSDQIYKEFNGNAIYGTAYVLYKNEPMYEYDFNVELQNCDHSNVKDNVCQICGKNMERLWKLNSPRDYFMAKGENGYISDGLWVDTYEGNQLIESDFWNVVELSCDSDKLKLVEVDNGWNYVLEESGDVAITYTVRDPEDSDHLIELTDVFYVRDALYQMELIPDRAAQYATDKQNITVDVFKCYYNQDNEFVSEPTNEDLNIRWLYKNMGDVSFKELGNKLEVTTTNARTGLYIPIGAQIVDESGKIFCGVENSLPVVDFSYQLTVDGLDDAHMKENESANAQLSLYYVNGSDTTLIPGDFGYQFSIIDGAFDNLALYDNEGTLIPWDTNGSTQIIPVEKSNAITVKRTGTKDVTLHISPIIVMNVYGVDRKTILTSEDFVFGHTWGEPVTTKNPTCENAGIKEITCTVCGEKKEEEIPSSGAHVVVVDEAIKATCMEPGLTAGKYCSVCHEVLEKQEIVPVDGSNHTGEIVIQNKKIATDTEEGYSGDRYCSSCGKLIETGKTIPKLIDLIQKDSEELFEEVGMDEITEIEEAIVRGNNSVSGTVIADTTEVKEAKVEGAALTAFAYAQDEDNEAGEYYAEMEISVLEDKVEEDYSAIVFDINLSVYCNGELVEENIEPVAPLRITFKLPEQWKDKDISECKLIHHKDDGTDEDLDFIVENGFISFETTSLSAFEYHAHAWDDGRTLADGVVQYTCIACGASKKINGHQHDFTDYSTTKPATCKSMGMERRDCKTCDYFEVRELEMNNDHTIVIDAAVEATCTDAGLTEGKHCIVCKKVFETQEIVNATGHKSGTEVKEIINEATCTKGGSYKLVVRCEYCDEVLSSSKTVKSKATGHEWSSWTVTKEATTSREGSESRTCETCGQTETRKIAKLKSKNKK